MGGRASRRARQGAHVRSPQRRDLRRGQVGGHQDLRPSGGLHRAAARQVRGHLRADGAQVLRPLPLVRVLDAVPGVGRLRDGLRPGGGGRLAAVAHPAPRRRQELLVFEEQEVGAEDGGVGSRRLRGDRRLGLPQFGRRGGERQLEGAPLGPGIAGRRGGSGGCGRTQPSGAAGGEAGRRRDAHEDRPRRRAPGERVLPDRRRPRGPGPARCVAGRRERRLPSEVLIGQAPQGSERLLCVRPGRGQEQHVPAPCPERRHGAQAPGAHGPAAAREVGDRDAGIEAGRGAHEEGGRPRVQSERRRDHHSCLGRRLPRARRLAGRLRGVRPCRRSRTRLFAPELDGLRLEPAASLGGTGFERLAEPCRDRRGDGALQERRLREQDERASLVVEEIHRHLRRQDGAPEVHQDQHAVVGPDGLDGAQDAGRVGAEHAGFVQTAGGADAHLRRRHLRGQGGDALGHLGAVADQDDADHAGAAPAAPPIASAAARSSSQDDVAPGSWCPALRSPR